MWRSLCEPSASVCMPLEGGTYLAKFGADSSHVPMGPMGDVHSAAAQFARPIDHSPPIDGKGLVA